MATASWEGLKKVTLKLQIDFRMIKVAKASLNIFLHWIFNINSRRAQGFNKPLTSFCKDICPYWLKITNILPLPILQYQVEGRWSRGRRLLNNYQVLNMKKIAVNVFAIDSSFVTIRSIVWTPIPEPFMSQKLSGPRLASFGNMTVVLSPVAAYAKTEI